MRASSARNCAGLDDTRPGQHRLPVIALRACCYRDPIFVTILFGLSMAERFGKDCDIRDITAFIARIRESREPADMSFPAREAEAMMRASLGERLMIDQLDPSNVAYLEIMIPVLTRLFDEWQASADEVTALFAKSEALAAEKRRIPLVTVHEDRWFAAGMADSPFATLDEPASHRETGS